MLKNASRAPVIDRGRWACAQAPAPRDTAAPAPEANGASAPEPGAPAPETGAARSAVIVPGYPGQPGGAELARQAAAGTRPRKDYVEVARALDADIVDPWYMTERASPVGRALANRAGVLAGELYEAFSARNRFSSICAWADRAGLPLALMYKLARSRADLALVSVYLSSGKKSMFLRNLGVHSHLGAIVNFSSVQMEFAEQQLRVPPSKLHHVMQSVDERFWHPLDVTPRQAICSVGWEARDYGTLVKAVPGLPVRAHIAVGTQGLSSSPIETDGGGPGEPGLFESMAGKFTQPLYRAWRAEVLHDGLPPDVTVHNQLSQLALRDLYARSRFVVVPLHEADFDAGVTTITEAMAMGKAVIITRTRAQVDVIRDGVHGLYVPPGDPRSLRQAIDYLLRNPEVADGMGRAGREQAEKCHALDQYARRVAAIVRESR